MSPPQIYETVIAEDARGRVYLPFPPDPAALWGAKPRHHVGGTLNGMSFRGVIEDFDGQHGVSIGPAWRRSCGLAPGLKVRAVLSAEGPQRGDLAPDIAEALDASPRAAAFFDGLAQFYRKGYLRWIDATRKRPDERARRIAEMVTLLEKGVKQKP